MSLAAATQWLFNFVIAKITPIMLLEITWGTFLLFGCITLVASIWAALFLPETSGMSLEAIGKSYEGNLLARSIADLSPRKRREYRATLIIENGGTADQDGYQERNELKINRDLEEEGNSQDDYDEKLRKVKKDDNLVLQDRDADRRD